MRLAPNLSFARELQPQNIEFTGFGGAAVIGTSVVECPVTNAAAYRDGSFDRLCPAENEHRRGRLCVGRRHTVQQVGFRRDCVASLPDKTRSEPHDSASLVLLGSRSIATPRAHSRQASKSSLALPDASRSPSKCAT